MYNPALVALTAARLNQLGYTKGQLSDDFILDAQTQSEAVAEALATLGYEIRPIVSRDQLADAIRRDYFTREGPAWEDLRPEFRDYWRKRADRFSALIDRPFVKASPGRPEVDALKRRSLEGVR